MLSYVDTLSFNKKQIKNTFLCFRKFMLIMLFCATFYFV